MKRAEIEGNYPFTPALFLFLPWFPKAKYELLRFTYIGLKLFH